MNNNLTSIVLTILLACAVVASQAQTASQGDIPVQTIVTVEARHGANPPNVSPDDVMVFQGRKRDKVTDFVPLQGERADVELFILIDDGSGANLGSQLDEIRKFINAQPPTTRIGIAYMQNGTARIEQNLTAEHSQAAHALRLPLGSPGVNSSPYFSLSDLIKRWPSSKTRREVLMISDGIDYYYGVGDLDDPYLSAAINDSHRAGIVVSAIYSPGAGHFGHSYWRTYWGQLYLAQVAERTGGESYYIGFTGAPVTFAPYLDDLSQRLLHQYLLTFLARPPKKAGLEKVKIKTELSGVDLVAPDQVYVAP